MSLLKRVFSYRVLPSWTILLLDIIIVAISVLTAFLLRCDPSELRDMTPLMGKTLLLCLVANLIFFRVFRTYSNVLRLSSFTDVMYIFVSLTLAYSLSIILAALCNSLLRVSIASVSVLLIAYIVNFLLMATSRMTIKTIYDFINEDQGKTLKTFVYGTQNSGVNIAKAIRMSTANKFHLQGFIADSEEMRGKVLMGVKVYMNDETLLEHIRENGVQAIIVSPKKAEMLKNTDITDRLLSENVSVYMAPDVTDDWQSLRKAGKFRAVQIEDLLGRDPIRIDMKTIASHLEGKRVLITGAAGSIGSEIMRQVAQFNPYQLILIDQAETPLHDIRLELRHRWSDIDSPTILADISNKDRMEEIFREYRPQYVFHAAAYKHVPMMEDNVSEAIQNNVLGTKILADLSVRYKVDRFVMISTDKAVNPSNVMGCSKRICEIYVQSLAKKIQREGNPSTQFITTRFGNVLGSNGSVIPLFHRQIEAGGPVTVTHPDIIRYFMTIPEACQLVLEAGSMGHGGEIYIFDMGEPVKILDLAKKMIRLSGRQDIKIEFTGLRHGEKLYEELLATRENTSPTSHDKIMVASVREYDFDDIAGAVDELIRSSYKFDEMETVALMKKMVPEFRSQNSPYSVLDND